MLIWKEPPPQKKKKNSATKTVYAINRFKAEYWKRCLTPPSHPRCFVSFIRWRFHWKSGYQPWMCVWNPFSNLELHLATTWVFIRYKIWGLFKRACLAIKCHCHDDVIKWKHFPRYWPFVRGIHRSPVNCPHKGQWRGALTFSLICAWINGWVNNREAGDLGRHSAHYDVIVMMC